MLHRLHSLIHNSVLLRRFLDHAAFLNAGECAWDDEKAGEEDPGREGGEEVVGAGDGVDF